jgi:hypothetical protein
MKTVWDPRSARRKLELLGRLERTALARPAAVEALHEILLFLRAHPDNRAVLDRTERMLARFDRRPDLRRHAGALAGSGIAGTVTPYPFFAPTAAWLARYHGDHLAIDWAELDETSLLEELLPLMALYAETPGLDQAPLSLRQWIATMKGPGETDAAFLIRRLTALPMSERVREIIHNKMSVPFLLAPGAGTPARTRAIQGRAQVHFQTAPLRRGRPVLAEEIVRPPRTVRPATRAAAREIIDLAHGMLVATNRELDIFSYASADDVVLADCGEGLVFAFIGFIPERRLLLETLYGYVILKNGVFMGYGTVASLFGSSEVAFNIADTFRGGEASSVFARLLACTRRLFGADTFSLDPYQIGEDNEEALASGAWWFYQKLGFRARDRAVLALMKRELRRMETHPEHRSSRSTLERLAAASVFFHLGPRRADVLGVFPLANVGLAVTRFLAARFGMERERAEIECARDAARRLGQRSFAGFTAGERLSWRRWAPLVCALSGVERWPAADQRAFAAVVRAKGSRRESEFVARFDAHARLRRALAALAAR